MGIERSIGLAIINKLAPQGIGANEIIRIARSFGGGYRRTEMLADIRTSGQRFMNQYFVEKTASNEVIPQGLMVEKDLGYDAKYRIYGNYSYYDEESDDYFEETKSFYSDDLTQKGKWEDDFVSAFDESYLSEGKEFIAFNITGVEHNTGYDY